MRTRFTKYRYFGKKVKLGAYSHGPGLRYNAEPSETTRLTNPQSASHGVKRSPVSSPRGPVFTPPEAQIYSAKAEAHIVSLANTSAENPNKESAGTSEYTQVDEDRRILQRREREVCFGVDSW